MAVDAPRNPAEAEASERVREVITEFSEKFDLTCRFAEMNQGCRAWVSSSISWFFEQVKFGVIVEEDILIDERFFDWCITTSARFDGTGDVMQLNAFVPSQLSDRHAPAHMSKYVTSWGWASWRTAWSRYDDSMHDFFEMSFSKRVSFLVKEIGCGWRIALHYALALQMARQGKLSSWAYRWALSIWRHGASTVSPGMNLSRNIGGGAGATHTSHEGLDRFHFALPELVLSSGILARHCVVDKRNILEVTRANSPLRTARMAISVCLPNSIFFWVRRKLRS